LDQFGQKQRGSSKWHRVNFLTPGQRCVHQKRRTVDNSPSCFPLCLYGCDCSMLLRGSALLCHPSPQGAPLHAPQLRRCCWHCPDPPGCLWRHTELLQKLRLGVAGKARCMGHRGSGLGLQGLCACPGRQWQPRVVVGQGLVCRYAPGLLLCLGHQPLGDCTAEVGRRRMTAMSAGPVAPRGDFGSSLGWEVHPLHLRALPGLGSGSCDFLCDKGQHLLCLCFGAGRLRVQIPLSGGRRGDRDVGAQQLPGRLLHIPALCSHHPLERDSGSVAQGCARLGHQCGTGAGAARDVWTPLTQLLCSCVLQDPLPRCLLGQGAGRPLSPFTCSQLRGGCQDITCPLSCWAGAQEQLSWLHSSQPVPVLGRRAWCWRCRGLVVRLRGRSVLVGLSTVVFLLLRPCIPL